MLFRLGKFVLQNVVVSKDTSVSDKEHDLAYVEVNQLRQVDGKVLSNQSSDERDDFLRLLQHLPTNFVNDIFLDGRQLSLPLSICLHVRLLWFVVYFGNTSIKQTS